MDKTEKVPLLVKLFSLLALMVVGFGIISTLGYNNMQMMKRNLDTIYFGSYIPVSKLERIRQLYSQELVETVHKTQDGIISINRAATHLRLITAEIMEHWQYYKKSYKRDDEKPLVATVDNEVKNAMAWLSDIQQVFNQNDIHKIEKLRLSPLLARIDRIDQAIGKIIEHENQEAYRQKVEINTTYQNTLQQLNIVLGIIFLCSLILALFIIRNIQFNHARLQSLTDELRFANANLKNLSITDTLTKVYNRRYFNVLFEKAFKKAYRDQQPLVFMMIDIDFFKKYNDTYGHQQGDECLKSVAQILQSNLRRPGDTVFRLGGEEFGVIIENADQAHAKQSAAMLVKSVAENQLDHKANESSPYVTISVGFVCTIPTSEQQPDDLIKDADVALYQAKKNGRNQAVHSATVCIDEPTPGSQLNQR